MTFRSRCAIVFAKLAQALIRTLGLGAAATWPGEIALAIDPFIVKNLSPRLGRGAIVIAGTNGKTTTSLMITKVLESQGQRVVHNKSGANLLNGIAAALIANSHADWGVFEVDENSLPVILHEIKPRVMLLLNLFRDQLDRYGETDVIADKWKKAVEKLPKDTTIILNADDPGIAYLGNKNSLYFGLNDKKLFLSGFEHATDSTFCPNCGARLVYEGIYYSHIGIWKCPVCKAKRPVPQVSKVLHVLPGLYNQYNALAALACAKAIGISEKEVARALSSFAPAFGRQEEFTVDGKKIKLFLSKNPAGFNASLRTVLEMGAKQFLFVLNDRIPDGRDISWIWDVDFEQLSGANITVSGDRVYDLALRMKYADIKNITVEENLEEAIKKSLIGEKLFVLATYSAMLEVRKILTGRKIL